MPRDLPLDEPLAQLLNKALRLEGFFPEFNAEHASKLFPRSAFCAYAPRETILSEGDKGRDLYIIRSGVVAITRRVKPGQVQPPDLHAGDMFGEIGLLKDGLRSATAVAREEAQVFRLDSRDVEYLINHNHELGEHLKDLLARRSV